MDENIDAMDNIYFNYCLSCYNLLAGYTRGYRDKSREFGLTDKEIKTKINAITKKAIELTAKITALIEEEEEDGREMAE